MPPVVSRSNQRKSKPANLSDPGENGRQKRAKQKIGDEMLELYELILLTKKRTTNGYKVLIMIVYQTPVMKNGFHRHNLTLLFYSYI